MERHHTKLIQARLLLQTLKHGDIPYSLPGIPGPKGMPGEHIQKALDTVQAASDKDKRSAQTAVDRIVYNLDKYGNRI